MKFHGDVTTETVEVSHVVVLIGGRPNLAFFDELDGGQWSLVTQFHYFGFSQSRISVKKCVLIFCKPRFTSVAFESVKKRLCLQHLTCLIGIRNDL